MTINTAIPQILKFNKSKIILIWFIILLISPILITSSIASQTHIITLDSDESIEVANQIGLDQAGDDPLLNPTTLIFQQINPSDNFQQASYIGNIEANRAIGFKFSANEGQSIGIEINVTGNLPKTEIIMDIFAGDNTKNPDYVDTFFPNYPGEFPVNGQYSVAISGGQYIILHMFGPVSPVTFGLTVIRIQEGAFNPGIVTRTQTFQSNAYGKINGIFDYLVNESEYINFDGTYSLNLGDFDENSSSVGKGIASSIFGLLRAGELVASESFNGGGFDPIQLHDRFLPYFAVSVELLNLARANLIHPTGGLFYEGDLSIPPTSYIFSLETNVYMLMAMLEVWNFYQHPDYSTEDFIKADLLLAQINRTIVDLNATFYNAGYKGFVETASVASDISIASPVQGSQVYLESNALLGEVAFGVLFANGDAENSSTQIDDLVFGSILFNSTTYISDNLVILTDEGKIGAEYYDHVTSLPSNSSTLISNSLLISLFTPIGARVFPNIILATEIAETAIVKFKSQKNGLLYDSIMLNSTSNSDHSSTINTVYFLTSLDRLAESWNFQEFNTDSAHDISRTWNKAVRDLQNDFNKILFDDLTNSYFAQYRHEANLFIKNNDDLLSNDFVANTVILDLLAKTFPVKVVLTAPNNFVVYDDAPIIMNIEQINPLRKSWLWFLPARNYTVQAHLSIPKHEVDETEDIDLSTFDFNSGFVDVLFTPLVRGDFIAKIELIVEGDVLLKGTLNLVTYGELYLDWDQSDFKTTTDKSEFEPSISIFDETGKAISNLEIDAFLGNFSQNVNGLTDELGVKARTDSSGKATLEFGIGDLQYEFPEFMREERQFLAVPILINVTNAGSLKYNSPIFHIDMTLEKNFLEITTSPENPEIVIIGKTLLQSFDYNSKLTPITIQVSTQDSSGKSVSADYISIDWAKNVDTDVDIFSETTTMPAIFTIDPTDVGSGSYEIEIRVQEDGFTRGDEDYITIFKTLIIEDPSLIDSAAAALFVFGGLIAGKILSLVYSFSRSKTQKSLECPNCGKRTPSTENACQYCGNVLPGKTLSRSLKDKLSPIAEKVMDLKSQKDRKEDRDANSSDKPPEVTDDDMPTKDFD